MSRDVVLMCVELGFVNFFHLSFTNGALYLCFEALKTCITMGWRKASSSLDFAPFTKAWDDVNVWRTFDFLNLLHRPKGSMPSLQCHAMTRPHECAYDAFPCPILQA